MTNVKKVIFSFQALRQLKIQADLSAISGPDNFWSVQGFVFFLFSNIHLHTVLLFCNIWDYAIILDKTVLKIWCKCLYWGFLKLSLFKKKKKKDPKDQMNVSYKVVLHFKIICLLTLSYPNITLSNYWFIWISD